MDMNKSSIFYLDDNNNYVDKENATHAIIRVVDENGNLISEQFLITNKKEEPIEEIVLSDKAKEFINGFGFDALRDKQNNKGGK